MMQASIQRTAQCSCGSVNVVAAGELASVVACHCVDCQRRTGSVLGVGAFADPAFPAPVRSVWERSRHAWMTVPVEHHFDKGRLPK